MKDSDILLIGIQSLAAIGVFLGVERIQRGFKERKVEAHHVGLKVGPKNPVMSFVNGNGELIYLADKNAVYIGRRGEPILMKRSEICLMEKAKKKDSKKNTNRIQKTKGATYGKLRARGKYGRGLLEWRYSKSNGKAARRRRWQ